MSLEAPGKLERAFVAVSLVLFSGALLPLLRPENSLDQVAGDPLSQAIWFGLYFVTACLILRDLDGFLRSLRYDGLLLAVIGMVVLSTSWSYAPEVTLRKSLGLVGSTLFARYLAQRFSFDELMKLVCVFLAISLVGSLGLIAAMPSLAIDQDTHAGAWRGLYEHKNEAGRLMVFGAVVFALQFKAWRKAQFWVALGGLGCFGFMLLTTSKTALLILVLLAAGLLGLPVLAADSSLLMGLGLVGLVLVGGLAAWLPAHLGAIATMLGRDLTLTGRTGIWEAVFVNLRDRLWLGYGYEAFWLGEAGDSAYVWQATNYHATFSHNGYLEVWLDIGAVGLALLGAHLGESLRRAAVLFRRADTPELRWCLFFLAFALLYNTTEAFLLKQNNCFWILYCVTTARLAGLYAAAPAVVAPAVPGSFSPPVLVR